MTFAYHRLARSWPSYRWWKPLVTGLIALGFFLVFQVMLAVPAAILVFVDPTGLGADFRAMLLEGVIDLTIPAVLAFSLASIAVMLPAIILAALIMGPRPVGLLSSVAGRLRWRWMLRLVVPGLVVFVGSFVLLALLDSALLGGPPALRMGDDTVLMLAIILLLVPLQATAEEYVFRGYLMQLIGGWLKHPAWAILLPVPLFMVGHLYDGWGLLDVGVFAVFAAWLTWRTGGLEAAIVAHVVNNATLFALGPFGLYDANSQQGSPLGVALTAVTLGLYSWWVVVLQRRHGVERVRLFVENPVEPAPSIVDNHSQA